MTKPREFWIEHEEGLRHVFNIRKPILNYEPASFYPKENFLHVREVSPEYDALVSELVETLKLYTDRPGRDCDKSTTKWSAADTMIAKYNAFMKGRE